MNFKRFMFCLALACIFAVGNAQAAPDKLKVTRDNFVSLEWRTPAPADETRTLDYLIDKNSIALLSPQIGGGYGGFGGGFTPYFPPEVRPLSTNQFEALVRALQLADVPAMARETAQSPKSSPPQQTLVLTLSGENNADQSFVVVTSGEKKSATCRKLSDDLAALVRGKCLAQAEPKAPATSQP